MVLSIKWWLNWKHKNERSKGGKGGKVDINIADSDGQVNERTHSPKRSSIVSFLFPFPFLSFFFFFGWIHWNSPWDIFAVISLIRGKRYHFHCAVCETKVYGNYSVPYKSSAYIAISTFGSSINKIKYKKNDVKTKLYGIVIDSCRQTYIIITNV